MNREASAREAVQVLLKLITKELALETSLTNQPFNITFRQQLLVYFVAVIFHLLTKSAGGIFPVLQSSKRVYI